MAAALSHEEIVAKVAAAFHEGPGSTAWHRRSSSTLPPSLTGVEADIIVRDADATNPDLQALIFIDTAAKTIDVEGIAICARLTREMKVYVYVPAGTGREALRELEACGARIHELREYEIGQDGAVQAAVFDRSEGEV